MPRAFVPHCRQQALASVPASITCCLLAPPAQHRRAWRLTRTLAEGAATLLAAAWQRDPAAVRTIFVPLASSALERPVRGREGRAGGFRPGGRCNPELRFWEKACSVWQPCPGHPPTC